MMPAIGRRTALKTVGVATVAGLFSDSASAESSGSEITHEGDGPTRGPRLDVELRLGGEEVTGWPTVTLPNTSTETASYREAEQRHHDDDTCEHSERTEWDNLTMSRGVDPEDRRVWDWHERVLEGEGGVREPLVVAVLDRRDRLLARYEFQGARPTSYSPPELDASAVSGDSALAEAEIEVAYERYKRTT